MQNTLELAQLYQNRFQRDFLQRKKQIWEVLVHDFFQRFVSPESVTIEIASGYGEFINQIRSNKKMAIDLNPDSASFVSKEVEFAQLPAQNLSSLGENLADCIFTPNFLEHLASKEVLNEVLYQVYLTLKPGGRFLILGPNLRYLHGKYWDFYDHHLGLTHLSLSEALALKGFRIQLRIDRFLPFTTQRFKFTHPFFVRLYLKLPWAWKIMGKQFFIVAEKPAG